MMMVLDKLDKTIAHLDTGVSTVLLGLDIEKGQFTPLYHIRLYNTDTGYYNQPHPVFSQAVGAQAVGAPPYTSNFDDYERSGYCAADLDTGQHSTVFVFHMTCLPAGLASCRLLTISPQLQKLRSSSWLLQKPSRRGSGCASCSLAWASHSSLFSSRVTTGLPSSSSRTPSPSTPNASTPQLCPGAGDAG